MIFSPRTLFPSAPASFFLMLSGLVLLGVGSAAIAEESAVVSIDRQTVVAGQPVTLGAFWGGEPLSGALVSVESRPSSQIARERTLGQLSERGEVVWTPELAGLVRVRVLDPTGEEELARRDFAVRYPGLPFSALVVLIGAGGLLFGGIWVGFGRQMGGP